MRVLMTGITGFVGSHMADYLLANIEDVHIFGSRRWRSREENIKHLIGNEQVTFVEADLIDSGSLHRLVRLAKPDYVFHFASQSFPGASFGSPVQTLMTNVIGTTNLLEALLIARNDGLCDPVIISVASSEVYGNPRPDEVPVTENNPLRPANPYSISKAGHDMMSRYYHDAFGLKVITTRMFSHEGPRRGKEFAISSFAHQIVQHEAATEKKDKYLINVGNLDSVRTYAHIEDAIRAYWLAATKGEPGDFYNIGGSETCTVGEALDILMDKSTIPNKQFGIVVDPARLRPTDITLQIPDCTKFKAQTRWTITKSLDDILEDLLNYWRGEILYGGL